MSVNFNAGSATTYSKNALVLVAMTVQSGFQQT